MPDSEQPKTLPWRDFEDEVAMFLESGIPWADFGIDASAALVRRKPRYFSKDRNEYIEFDASVEVKGPRQDRPTIVWLWECKNYPDRNVPVDDVEELYCKMVQVAAHKATIVTRRGFAKGATSFAVSKGMSLMVLVKKELTVLLHSQRGGDRKVTRLFSPYVMFSSGREIDQGDSASGPNFDSVLKVETREMLSQRVLE